MHEYSIVAALVTQVEDEARKHEGATVTAVHVCIGELSGVEPELLSSAWDLVRARSRCGHARLALQTAPARWACRACEREIERGGALVCARCGAPARLVEGDELVLLRIEMEVETRPARGDALDEALVEALDEAAGQGRIGDV